MCTLYLWLSNVLVWRKKKKREAHYTGKQNTHSIQQYRSTHSLLKNLCTVFGELKIRRNGGQGDGKKCLLSISYLFRTIKLPQIGKCFKIFFRLGIYLLERYRNKDIERQKFYIFGLLPKCVHQSSLEYKSQKPENQSGPK